MIRVPEPMTALTPPAAIPARATSTASHQVTPQLSQLASGPSRNPIDAGPAPRSACGRGQPLPGRHGGGSPTATAATAATSTSVWNLRPMPQGGLVTAIALRAMAAELDDPAQRLRSAHTTFAAQVADGTGGHRRRAAAAGAVDVAPPGRGPQPGRGPGSPDHRHLRRHPGGLRLHRPRAAGRRPPPRRLPVVPRAPAPGVRGRLGADAVLGAHRRGPRRRRPSTLGGLRPRPGRARAAGTASTTRRCGTTAPSTRSPLSCWPT